MIKEVIVKEIEFLTARQFDVLLDHGLNLVVEKLNDEGISTQTDRDDDQQGEKPSNDCLVLVFLLEHDRELFTEQVSSCNESFDGV